MKMILTLASIVLSFNVFSQSYLILSNGVTLTTDKKGMIYDFNHFIPPYRVTANGGQFLAEDERLITIDENGYLYRKEEKFKKIKFKGNNYAISENGELITFDTQGFFYKFEDVNFKDAKHIGGNFFTIGSDFYTVNSTGNYFKLKVDGLNPADIITVGGNYLMTNKGLIYSVTKEGYILVRPEVKPRVIKKAGGNFFIDAAGGFFTVSEEGFVYKVVLPVNLKVDAVSKMGTNYLIDQTGKIFLIDATGAIYERHISHDLTIAKILSR